MLPSDSVAEPRALLFPPITPEDDARLKAAVEARAQDAFISKFFAAFDEWDIGRRFALDPDRPRIGFGARS